jgi:ATP-dependent Clp protease ATP-binding subunit ClpX
LSLILKASENSLINHYKNRFIQLGITLEFEFEAINAIAKEAVKRGGGAWVLPRIIDDVLEQYYFPLENSTHKVVLTQQDVEIVLSKKPINGSQ